MSSKAAATRPVRHRSSGQQTRAEILAAAERHFAERGFEAARLEDIAADVGIRRAAIFYHFGDKQELYAAVLDSIFGGWPEVLPSAGSVAERLEASLRAWIDYIAGRPSVARLILREAARIVRRHGHAWIVVSTSAYGGIEVPVDLILADIAGAYGWKLDGIHVLRYLRAAGQHWAYLQPGSSHPLRESLIILKQ